MPRPFQCPTRTPEGTRTHDRPSTVWLKALPGPDIPRTMRPWCRQCLIAASSTDSVIVAQRITDFYPGTTFAIVLTSVEQWRRKERARRAVPEDSEPADANREAEFGVLAGTYVSRGAITPRAWQRMQGLRPMGT
jgi:hypothetical protein